MKRILSMLPVVMTAAGLLLSSCDKNELGGESDNNGKPSVEVKDLKATRTAVQFTITADKAADYAYDIINTSGNEGYVTAEELFEKGNSAMFETPGSVTVNYDGLSGGNKYILQVAVRTINPIVYSDIVTVEIDTDIEYTDVITMEHVGLTDFEYHVEVPELQQGIIYKHIVVGRNDYEAIKKIFEASFGGTFTYGQYLGTFGHTISESGNTKVDKYAETAQNDPINVYSATEYIVIAGQTLPDNEYKIDENTVQTLSFHTKTPEETPFRINVNVDDITSMTARINVVPEDGITEYRMLVAVREEFEAAAIEGDESIKALVIGYWDDTKNIEIGAGKRAYEGKTELNQTGLKPNTNYTVGIIGFDEELRECVILKEFTTGEPTGPKPEITLTEEQSATPWKNINVNIKTKNTASMYVCLSPKDDFDRLLNEGVTLDEIIINNGTAMSSEDIHAAQSDEGLIVSTEELSAATGYSIGVYAANPEGVGISKRIDITTAAAPQFGGEIRENMPGEYTATAKDETGNTVSFPVTIAAGVNEATTKEYSAKNRLVALGFGNHEDYQYTSPEEMLAKGWAKDEAEANRNYGPKWFIEFNEDGSISTSKPVEYELDYNMAVINGKNIALTGFYESDGQWNFSYTPNAFPIEVSEDGNTITVKAFLEKFEWSPVATAYYPGMSFELSVGFEPIVIFTSEIVLQRKISAKAAAGFILDIGEKMTTARTFYSDHNRISIPDFRKAATDKLR